MKDTQPHKKPTKSRRESAEPARESSEPRREALGPPHSEVRSVSPLPDVVRAPLPPSSPAPSDVGPEAVEPLFEPELLEPARANADFVDTRTLAAEQGGEPEHEVTRDAAERAPEPVLEATDSRPRTKEAHATGLGRALRMMFGAFTKPKRAAVPAPVRVSTPSPLTIEQPELAETTALVEVGPTAIVETHAEQTTARVEAEPIAEAILQGHAREQDLRHEIEHELEVEQRLDSSHAKHDETVELVAPDGRAIHHETHEEAKELGHERAALENAAELEHSLAATMQADELAHPHEAVAEHPAEHAHERDALAKARELQHELADHLHSHELEHHEQLVEEVRADRERRGERVNARAEMPEVQALPLSRQRVAEHPALYVGSVSWILCGLASAILGVVAVAGVTHKLALDQVALLICAAALVTSSLSLQLRGRARHDGETQAGGENA